MNLMFKTLSRSTVTIVAISLVTACAPAANVETASKSKASAPVPADVFDLSHWSITLPTDVNNDKKVDSISPGDLASYSHPDFFHLDDQKRMVFTTPNKALTTPNSSNTRSELRYMSAGSDRHTGTKSPANNFALAAHPKASEFGSIGHRMEATLHVDAVALNAGRPDKFPAYSAVVGQIHAVKFPGEHVTSGWGNEPLKIYFKKWPNHEKGSVFWTYERNLAKKDPNRTDIAYPVWGNTWDNPADPGDAGISLGEEFSYVVNVHNNIMSLTFETASHKTVSYKIDLSNNVDAYGNVDKLDNSLGYSGDAHYFKAGIYDQCSTSDAEGFWYPACPGTGDWDTDEANGDFARATFSRLVVSESVEN